MRIRVSFKTPDAVDSAIQDAVSDLPEDEQYDAERSMDDFVAKFVQYGEYVQIEFDDVAGTATVVGR
jgi:hypothetical protein